MQTRPLSATIALIIFITLFQLTLPTPITAWVGTPTPDSTGVDLTRLPLGDGRLSTAPKVGWVWPCRVEANAGGAFRDGPWIKKDGTFDLTKKAVVDGAVLWPQHKIEIVLNGTKRVITSNDLPDHPTGVFPIAQTDDAFQYDRNPNKIAVQNFRLELPANPTLLAQPTCTPGAIGILITGVALFNPLDAPGRDAVAHETQDACQGHPQVSGDYHYHSLTNCLPDLVDGSGHSTLVGYALDGFGIYGRHGEGGKVLTSADLDECHGHTHEIEWDGKKVTMYHYHATWDFPYTVGCMRGAYSMADMMTISGGPGGGGQPGGNTQQGVGNVDLAAAAKKLGISEQALRDALGPPPPNLAAAAKKLGITEKALRDALGIP